MTADSMPPPPPPRARGRSAWSRCDEPVARVAPTATTTCQVCSSAIAQGAWQLGVMFIHVEGFMLMEWYHLECSEGIPGGDVLEAVQTEMTPAQRLQFRAAYEKLASGGAGNNAGDTGGAMASATMVS